MQHLHVAVPTTPEIRDAALLATLPRDGEGLLVLENTYRERWVMTLLADWLLADPGNVLSDAEVELLALLRERQAQSTATAWYGAPKTPLQRRIVRTVTRLQVMR